MKKLKLSATAFNKGEVLSRAQLKKVMGGLGSGTPCSVDFDCGVAGNCLPSGFCDNSWGGGTDCYDGNNGGCQIGRICIMDMGLVRCI